MANRTTQCKWENEIDLLTVDHVCAGSGIVGVQDRP